MCPPPIDPLAAPPLWDRVAEGYAAEIAPHLTLYAEDALRVAGVSTGMKVADVACGPGTLALCAARRGARASALDFSPGMIARLEESARRAEIADVEARVGDGMDLPYPDATFDAAFSMFGLIFFPDRARGFRELLRVLRTGGCAVVSSWVSTERVPVMADIYGTLAAALPASARDGRLPLADPDALRAEMAAAGFRDVAVQEVTHAVETPSAEVFWESLARNTPPLRAAREALGEERWPAVAGRISEVLRARWGHGPQRIAMPANLGVGRR